MPGRRGRRADGQLLSSRARAVQVIRQPDRPAVSTPLNKTLPLKTVMSVGLVAPFEGSQPSSCSYWRLAAGGRTFYTTAADHQNCPIGGYTHNLLQPETMPQLNQTLTLMGDIGYIRMEEIAGVFQLKDSPGAVVYAPLGETPVAPSVV